MGWCQVTTWGGQRSLGSSADLLRRLGSQVTPEGRVGKQEPGQPRGRVGAGPLLSRGGRHLVVDSQPRRLLGLQVWARAAVYHDPEARASSLTRCVGTCVVRALSAP